MNKKICLIGLVGLALLSGCSKGYAEGVYTGTAIDIFVHVLGLDFGAVEHLFHDDGGQFLLVILAQSTVHLTDRGSDAICNYDISHIFHLQFTFKMLKDH